MCDMLENSGLASIGCFIGHTDVTAFVFISSLHMDSTLPIENTASQEFGHTFSFNVFIIFYLFINSTIFIIIFMTIYIFDND